MKKVIRTQTWLMEKRNAAENHLAEVRQRVEDGDRGASMVEYGILVGLIAVVAIIAITTLGQKVNNTFNNVASTLPG